MSRKGFVVSTNTMLPAERYTHIAIVLHWVIAIAVIGQFALGWEMLSIPKQPPGLRADAFNLHKSLGLTIFGLICMRMLWHWRHPPPPLPPMAAWQSMLARFTHLSLYAALIVMPVAGYVGSVFSGFPVKYFGITLPAWGWKEPAIKDLMSSVHYVASWVLAGAVLLHVAGALKHWFVDRDALVARMGLPVFKIKRESISTEKDSELCVTPPRG